VRPLAGLVIQDLFAAFAANFVRWAAAWLHETCPNVHAPFDTARIAANTFRLGRLAARRLFVKAHRCVNTFTSLWNVVNP